MGNDPFDRFARKKAADNRIMEEKARAEQQSTREMFQEFKVDHQKILDIIKRCNPEPILIRLYEIGFRGNKKYDQSHITRDIHRFVISDLYEKDSIYSSAERFSTDIITEINSFSSKKYLANWKKSLQVYHRYDFKGSPQICISKVVWQLVLWEKSERVSYDTWGDVPYGPVISVTPNGITVGVKLISPLTAQNLSNELAVLTEQVIGQKGY